MGETLVLEYVPPVDFRNVRQHGLAVEQLPVTIYWEILTSLS